MRVKSEKRLVTPVRISRAIKRELPNSDENERPKKRQKRARKAQPTPEMIIRCLETVSLPKTDPNYMSKVHFIFR